MLRVGLTGALGSGKSTVAKLLAARGAVILSSDEMAREMMQPGHPVYDAIVARFGPAVVLADGSLDRGALARLAFDPVHPRVEELNAIVHPPVIAAQAEAIATIAARDPHAIVVVESALLLSTKHAGPEPWRNRFDLVIVVSAPKDILIDRFIARASADHASPEARVAIRADAERRLAAQHWPEQSTDDCIRLVNEGPPEALETKADMLWKDLLARERQQPAR